MSFLKISDPAKRDSIVKEYLELKKNIRDNLLSERTGGQQLQTDLSKFFKPITETQKATAREITEELKPIKEGIGNLPQAITFPTFPAFPSIQLSQEEILNFGKVAADALRKFLRKNEADTTFGIRDEDGKFKIGDRWVKIKDNDIEVLDESGVVEETYKGTPGLWELITAKEPKDETIMQNDLNNYGRLMVQSGALHHNNHPKRPRSADSYKWKNILSYIWHNRKKYEGKGVVVIPSDPNALVEKLDLLLSSQEARHTNVGNELVSICDELKRQGVLDIKTYKKINSIIKK